MNPAMISGLDLLITFVVLFFLIHLYGKSRQWSGPVQLEILTKLREELHHHDGRLKAHDRHIEILFDQSDVSGRAVLLQLHGLEEKLNELLQVKETVRMLDERVTDLEQSLSHITSVVDAIPHSKAKG